jgi:hypothetical protein
MSLVKPQNNGIRKFKCKAARSSGGVDSSNPHRWRGKRLHRHHGDVCCVFVLCVAVSSGRLTHQIKKYQNITLRYTYPLTIRFIGITF